MNRAGRTTLATRFLVYFAVAYLALIGLMAVAINQSAERALIEDLTNNLETGVELASLSLPEDEGEMQAWADTVFETGGFRVTVIDEGGVVIADSHSDPAVMENHSDRPEIVAAIETGEPGVSSRRSASTGATQIYVALPPQDDLVVRGSVPTRLIGEELASVRNSIIAVSLIAGLVGIVMVGLLARRMSRPISELTDQSLMLADGNYDIDPRRSVVREFDQLGLAISSLAMDLKDRVREAEDATAYLEATLGALPQGTILIDSADNVVYANPSALGMLGAIPDDLSALSPFPLQTAALESRETRQTVRRTVEHGQPVRLLRVAVSPFEDDNRVLIVLTDATEQERVAAVRRDFVANASHELKTPVSSIIAAAEALRIAVERGDDSSLRFAEQIEGSARQLDGLVADLLDLSRLEREEPEMIPIRLDLLIAEEVERARPEAALKRITFESDLARETVDASYRDLATAVRNLLDNAIRYTPEGGSVEVSLVPDDEGVRLDISDTGEGIPSRDLERVFERFYRVDAARSRATGGTGLGLSIVKHVVESHGGLVRVESELGVGSKFTVLLPASDAAEDPEAN